MSELTVLLDYIKAHIDSDERQFEALNRKLTEISTDVKSLVEARAYSRGVSWAVYVIAGLVATATGGVASVVVAWALRAAK